jgi:hypothetical protein
MICVVALLITPGPYHRIVQNGEDSRSFHHLVTTIASLALVPFAIALGLDVVVTFGHLLVKCQVWSLESQPVLWRSASGTDIR